MMSAHNDDGWACSQVDALERVDLPNICYALEVVHSRGAFRCPYAAPEILEGAPYTEKVDLWSLGVIAHMLYVC